MGGRPRPDIVWYLGEQRLAHGQDNGRFMIDSHADGTCSLTVHNIRELGSVKFRCRASNECGMASSTVELVQKENTNKGLSTSFFHAVRLFLGVQKITLGCVILI